MLFIYLIYILMLTAAAVRSGNSNALTLSTSVTLLFSGVNLWSWQSSLTLIGDSLLLLSNHVDTTVLLASSTSAYAGSSLSLLSWSVVYSPSRLSHIDVLYPTAWWSGLALCMCQHALLIQVLIELQSIAVYVLSAKSVSTTGLKSSVLYYLIGALASTLLGAGSSTLYASTGSLDLSCIQSYDSVSVSYTTGLVVWLSSLLVKSGVAPYHQWATSVYSLGSWSLVSWMAVAPKVPLLQVLSMSHSSTLDTLLVFTSILSLLIGSVLALGEHEWRLLMAYSTLANVGYVLLIQLDWSCVWLLYLAQYTATTLTVYSLLSSLSTGRVSDVSLLLSLGICLMSLGGIPPLIGFVAKWLLVLGLAESSLWLVTLVVLVISVLTCYVYLTLLAHSRSTTLQDSLPVSLTSPLSTLCGSMTALSYLDSSLTVLNVCCMFSPDLLYDVLLLLSLRCCSTLVWSYSSP